jgi:hypothetical protein
MLTITDPWIGFSRLLVWLVSGERTVSHHPGTITEQPTILLDRASLLRHAQLNRGFRRRQHTSAKTCSASGIGPVSCPVVARCRAELGTGSRGAFGRANLNRARHIERCAVAAQGRDFHRWRRQCSPFISGPRSIASSRQFAIATDAARPRPRERSSAATSSKSFHRRRRRSRRASLRREAVRRNAH